MSKEDNANLAAFANPGSDQGIGSMGLSKREYFAAKAMQGIMANPACSPETQQQFMNIAEDAVRIADELLKQLEK